MEISLKDVELTENLYSIFKYDNLVKADYMKYEWLNKQKYLYQLQI